MGPEMIKPEDLPISSCQRCGACCRKGGPALHLEDRELVDQGKIPLASLYTLRKGELARDNIKGGLIRLSAEIVKIRSLPDAAICMYFNETDQSCDIYLHRPVECRILECWNTNPIEGMYARTRLSRYVLLEKVGWLAELVQAHEEKCALDRAEKLVQARIADDPAAADALNEIINYDFHLRQVAAEKGGLSPDIMDFLFGRPLAEVISRQFGVKVQRR